jgi:cyclic beta-1,2-glucan synthetase
VLLGADQLADRARAVGRQQRVATGVRSSREAPLLTRLTHTRAILQDAYDRLAAGSGRDVDVGPAGAWLLDNFHVVVEHIDEVRATLPRDFYRELPELVDGPLAGYPRVYELTVTLVSHSEARVDRENLDLFFTAFQETNELSLGELWALPAMLRLVLIESVRRMALRTLERMDSIEQADRLAGSIEAASARGPAASEAAFADFVAAPPRLTPAFVSRFLHQLRLTRQAHAILPRVEEWVVERAMGAEEAAALAAHHLALTQVMMAHSIGSLRTMAHLDWRSFVEGQSVTESVLRTDPAGFYPRMTFATRDSYRHAVERIARGTGRSEAEIARRAIELAGVGATDGGDPPLASHVGYHLVDEGRARLERSSGYRSPPSEAVRRWVLAHPNAVFATTVVIGTMAVLAAVLALAGPSARGVWFAVILVAALPALDIAISLVNQLVTAYLPPRPLPKLDLHADGIPPEFRTAVVVPTLFDSVATVTEALGDLEVQFLSNRETNLHFALLSDFVDSAAETDEADAAIVAAAVAGVRELNDRYAPETRDAFFLFHRPRRWNARQGVWMGWERKRGKLGEFNRFLRGGSRDAFSAVEGNVGTLRGVRYVITLDADTVLPPDAAPALIGALAHPLNRAVFDPALGRVVRGYGILQPRVGVSLPSAHRSRFAKIHSGHPGVDPYTVAVSDVYQDLFGEGSFTGKGIYDLDTFEQATHGRFPENTLLSHDLIEGNYARAGLATEVNVYDDYPTRYLTHARRKHRWIRGDWQLLGWLGGSVPGPDGPEPNRLSMLSRWKILDNLRRSTLEIGLLLFLVAGWTVIPGSPLRWTLLFIAAVAAPWLISLLLAAARPPRDGALRPYYVNVARDALASVRQVAIAVTFLPHQAWISADAIVRTLWRMYVSRRSLLEWQTAVSTERNAADSVRRVARAMWPAPAIAAAVAALVATAGTGLAGTQPWTMVLAAAPLIGLWFVSPALAHALSTPPHTIARTLPDSARAAARRLALLHWRFFDRFVGPDTHWLAPDNFQESPAPVLAMRTSPTNIGLHLLAVVSARDLGFLSTAEMTERLENAFDSLDRLARFRGHFLNWYELDDLTVLEPAYVSTVDSGNLAGHLLAVRQACLEVGADAGSEPGIGPALRTALGIADERLRELAGSAGRHAGAAADAARRDVRSACEQLDLTGGSTLSGRDLLAVEDRVRNALAHLESAGIPAAPAGDATEWLRWSLDRLAEPRTGSTTELATPARLEALADRAHRYVVEMDFGFLFDPDREIFSIGYRVHDHARDESYYDLLASEARLASFIAIAKNEVPVDHWFRLGRSLNRAGGETAMVSWSGSMFEYLMPALVMRSIRGTVLWETALGAVRRQVAYGVERDVPWGVSESAYNVRDRFQTYQYRAFGVPDLALKRGLGSDLVVAPYAAVLAAMVDPLRALANLEALEALGALGPYGLREALDFTRPDPGHTFALVGCYMAHHVGMSLVALTNVLTGDRWVDRFHTDPLVRSVDLLLHERVPNRIVLRAAQQTRPDEALPDPEAEIPAVREYTDPDTPTPHIALLGRQPYTVMVSHAGAGYSNYEDLAVTRWRADGTADATGQFCYVRDLTAGRTWSVAHQPLCVPADSYRADLATDRVTFHRRDGDVETRTEIAVVPEDAAEVRRVTVTNHGSEERELELTSYAEVVLGRADADRAHPAFANLFVETEWHPWCTAVTATRRPRSASDPVLIGVHVVDSASALVGEISCETDRDRFLGRGRTARAPAALSQDGALSGTTGAVLDPVFALRARVRLAPGETAAVAFTTLVATSRRQAFELASRYHDPHTAQRALDLAWTSQQVELRELDLRPSDTAVYQELASRLLFPHETAGEPDAGPRRTPGAQPLLWEIGVSGDWPIICAEIDDDLGLPTLRALLAAHHYLRRRGMTVDLVVVNRRPASYVQALHDRIMEAMFVANDMETDRPGGVFIRRADQLGREVLAMVRETARVRVHCDGRSLAQYLDGGARSLARIEPVASRLEPAPRPIREHSMVSVPGSSGPTSGAGPRPRVHPHPGSSVEPADPRRSIGASEVPASEGAGPDELRFANGYGGLDARGDYRVLVRGNRVPPAPWSNVVANPTGGFVVTERGGGFTWAGNSYFFRLTPWHNDPVSDPVSDVVYLRDEGSGAVWSATPAPAGGDANYEVRHGAGSTTFDSERDRIATRLTLAMADGEAVRLGSLGVTNLDDRPRRISVTAYVEWTLGVHREQTQHHVSTSYDEELGAVLARNPFDAEFSEWVAFCALSEPVIGHTGDRRAFLGRNGTAGSPAGMGTRVLDGRTGAGLDPCAALRCVLDLAPGESREVTVILGATDGEPAARSALARFRAPGAAADAIDASVCAWDERLSAVSVRTPDPAFDAMINRWALYQALSCRIWARSALYQSSGAYGFRDQLQDVLAVVHAEPEVAREHIVRASARQFREGDVQHWWHPGTGRGVRTRFSDDLVWLPHVVEGYVAMTGDASVLDEQVPFLDMRVLEPFEDEAYDLPQVTGERASIYEHSLRALRRACTLGEHDLPLIGSGDWNDGMNRVGTGGRGESVWLGWFLIATLRSFAGLADERGDAEVAADLRSRAERYRVAVEEHGWDGEWYRRAYFDDGTPLGSSESDECRIDSIAQSWGVISRAAAPERQAVAMRSLEAHLVDPDARLIRLLTPPFDRTSHDPGYIKGYLPGVRENGAQYTHAALWAVLATAMRGDGDRAFRWYSMLNPLTHTDTAEGAERYRVEPYVIAADVYTAAGQVGRGGWSWYTGSASWMYRVGLESILGFTRRGSTLRMEPSVPADWPSFALDYRFGTATYEITVEQPAAVRGSHAIVVLDGEPIEGAALPLVDDGQRHVVVVRPGEPLPRDPSIAASIVDRA